MAYIGKTYAYEKGENFEAFVDSLGLPAERAEGVKKFNPTQKLLKDGDTYTLVTKLPNGDKEVKFQSGVEFVENLEDAQCNTTITVDGNTVTQVQKFGDGRTLTFKKVYSEDKLVATLTSNFWDGTAYRYYTAV